MEFSFCSDYFHFKVLPDVTTHCNRWLCGFVQKVFAEHKVARSQCEKDSAAWRLHVLGTRGETLRDLTGKEKKRKTSAEEDRPMCLAPYDPSARTFATTFKLSVRLGLVGISSF